MMYKKRENHSGSGMAWSLVKTVFLWCFVFVGSLSFAGKAEAVVKVKAVSTGTMYSAILKTDGSLWTCGYNFWGQLGDGTTEKRSTPVKIMSGVAAVSTSGIHTAILKSNGSLWMCGWNEYGQLGDGTTEDRSTPVEIMSGVAAVSAGG